MSILAKLLTDIKMLLGDIGISSASADGQTITNNKLTSIDNKTPNLINNRIPVDVQSLSVTVNNASLEISNDVGNAIPVIVVEDIGNASLALIAQKTPNITGIFGYKSATNGTLTLTGSKRVLSITASSGNTASTIQINGGDIINIPILKNISIEVAGNITDPTIVFTNTTSYFVSYVS